jgi:integrase
MRESHSTNSYVTKDNELQEIFNIYLSECEFTKRLRSQTIKGYQEVFNTFQKTVPEVRSIADLNCNVISEFFKRIGTRKRQLGNQIIIGVKPSTTSTYYRKLMAFIHWLENNGYAEHHSISAKIARPPTPVYDDDRALTDEEVSKLLSTITLYGMDDDFKYKRDLVIISILLYTGIRKGELLGLRVQDIDLDNKSIFINSDTSKSKKSRSVPMHSMLKARLKEYLQARKKRKTMCTSLIVSSKQDRPFTTHGLKHWVQKYKTLSGVNFHLHRCRHTFACSLAKTSADVTSIMKVLGHTSTRMTERYLRSIKTEDSRSYIDKLSF